MSWDDVEKAGKPTQEAKKKQQEKREREVELTKKFSRLFTSDDGKVVMEHLFNMFVMTNDTPLNSPNVTYEAGYHAGEAGVIKYITNQISKAKTL